MTYSESFLSYTEQTHGEDKTNKACILVDEILELAEQHGEIGTIALNILFSRFVDMHEQEDTDNDK